VDHTRAESHGTRCVPGALASCLLVLWSPPARAGDAVPPKPVLNRWSAVLYGFAELDAIHDSLQGTERSDGNALLPRSGTYAATHDQTTIHACATRGSGFEWARRTSGPLGASAVAEMASSATSPR
jgi:hypothetical protein